MNTNEIIRALRENAEWCDANEYEVPLCMGDNQRVAADLIESLQAQTKVTGGTSDGYHTFNELYHHRAVLFSVICNDRPNVSWKSKLHHDGTMFDSMFIVGIQTPEGQATYHYDIDPYWDMFRVPELPQAPEWDEHTSEQAIERIGNLPSMHTNLSASQRGEKSLTRCENCIHWDKSISFMMSAHACSYWSPSKSNPRYTAGFEFCSFAKAKPEER